MTSFIPPQTRRQVQTVRPFGSVYVATLIFAFHWSLVAYVNSTYLAQFVSAQVVGVLYIIASAITIGAFFFVPRALRARGNYRLTLTLGITETLLLIALAVAPSPYLALPLFVLHHALVPLLLFTIDIFVEERIGNHENITGSERGMQLAIIALGYALAILISGTLLGGGRPRFVLVYLASAACMLVFCQHIHQKFKNFRDPSYSNISVLAALRHFLFKNDFRFVFLSHFLLQLFFAWTVIYIPLYLSTIIGLGWDKIGLILFVGLFAYVLLEYPIGKIADRWIGEKEMMAAGFIVLALTTMYIAFLHTSLLLPWMIMMFMTRLGASLVEVTTESYFFKHTKDTDANIISFFRASAPLAYLVGGLLGTLTFLFIPFNYAFFLLGLLMLPGIAFAICLKDTR